MLRWSKRQYALLKQAVLQLLAHDGMQIAGYAAYNALLSLFPFIIFLFALAAFFREDILAQRFVNQSFAALPPAVADALLPVINDILKGNDAGLLTLGILGTLWTTISGVEALRLSLNRAYQAEETRALWRRYLADIGIVICAALSGLVLSGCIILAPVLLRWARLHFLFSAAQMGNVNIGRYIFTLVMLTAIFTSAYTILPNHVRHWKATLPGAFLAAILWMLLGSGFSLYLEYFNRYNATYGSLGGIVLTLFFLQLSVFLFMLGAEYNAALKA